MKGLEPSTFCMARGTWQPFCARFLPANQSIPLVGGRLAIRPNPGEFGGVLPPNSHPGHCGVEFGALGRALPAQPAVLAELPPRVRPVAAVHGERVPDVVHELLATEVARDKLAARGISTAEVEQVPRNLHRTVRNPREETEPGRRRLLIGETDGGRVLTLVIDRTVEPTTWLVVTGWNATAAERNLLS
jgi:uncharacterized DUF497 family protein